MVTMSHDNLTQIISYFGTDDGETRELHYFQVEKATKGQGGCLET